MTNRKLFIIILVSLALFVFFLLGAINSYIWMLKGLTGIGW